MARKEDLPSSVVKEARPSTAICDERLKVFKDHLQKFFRENRASNLPISRIITYINRNSAVAFSQDEIDSAFEKMTDDNQVMAADEIV